MSRIMLTSFALLLLLFFGNSSENYAAQSKLNTSDAPTGTFQKMIVENGSVTMNLDLNRFNAISSVPARATTLGFAAAANSFFTILVFNDLLRSPEPGSMALVPESEAAPTLPAALTASLKQLVIEKLPSDAAFDLAVRDGKTGFTFFNIEGHQYDYDPNAQSLSITGGNLLVSQEFANALGQPSAASATVGKISIGTTMQPIEIRTILNGEIQSVIMPPLRGLSPRSEAQVGLAGADAPTLVAGPDVIVGVLPEMAQYGSNGSFVGLGIGTTSCNNGDQPLHWFALPNTDHPVIPQNFYRMSGALITATALNKSGNPG